MLILKRVIIACVLSILLIASCFISYNYIDKTTSGLSEHLQKAAKAVDIHDFSTAHKQMEKVYNHCERYNADFCVYKPSCIK